MAEDKLQRLRNLMNSAKDMIASMLDGGVLFDEDGELFSDSAALIIALHEMGCPEYDSDKELVVAAYQFARDYEWFDGTGFPAENPFEKESKCL